MSGGKTKAATQRKNGKYGAQKIRTEANRTKNRKRHGEKHPNDKQEKGVKTGRQIRVAAPPKKDKKEATDAPLPQEEAVA